MSHLPAINAWLMKWNMKRFVLIFAALWGVVVAGLVASMFSVGTSISFGALNAVAYSPISMYFALFLVLALFVWLIPVAVLWLIARNYEKSSNKKYSNCMPEDIP